MAINSCVEFNILHAELDFASFGFISTCLPNVIVIAEFFMKFRPNNALKHS